MGNPKQKWTAEEEEALRAGVAKHGAGKWKNIQRDPEFNHLLFARSNIDLKDKWRNLSVASGQGLRDKPKAAKGKANPAEAPAAPLPAAQTSGSAAPSCKGASTDVAMMDSSKPLPEGIGAAKCTAMIFEALSTLNDLKGSDSSAIASFIEKRYEVPHNFRRSLTSRLRTLVQQDKLEKVNNYYKIKNSAALDTKPPAPVPAPAPVPRQRDVQPRPIQSIGNLADTVEEAAASAAYKIAEAENKSFVAAESVKESERVDRMAEEMESQLQFAMDCYEQSSRGDILLIS
ncbi:telomere repeat-binding factor 4-like [Salvia hispanica]|uniref:telomere repeat-binding factor 4-like n=1 Tax=Salvia hispanica TaxID=49212 RepID=UPI00200947F5|nr:telomere repeat-binding factor 4-like [Salvia hispanica]